MAGRLFFDVSGLVQWYAYLRHASGIQRVMEGTLAAMAEEPEAEVEFICRAIGSDRFFRIDPRAITGLRDEKLRPKAIAHLRRRFCDSKKLAEPRRLRAEMRWIHAPYIAAGWAHLGGAWERWNLPKGEDALGFAMTPASSCGERDTIICLGDFWCHRGHAESLIRLKMNAGAQLFLMIHDLIPILQPQWTHPHYGAEFVAQFRQLAPHVDHWFTNSQYVRAQLAAHLQAEQFDERPATALPMGWPPYAPLGSAAADNDAALLSRIGIKPGRFFLHVGTVEPRKNLAQLIDAATALREEIGPDMPTCVLVGREGWLADDVKKRLQTLARQPAIVRWLRNVDDPTLAALYRNARFCVIPSHDEGWGLSVQESLSFGTPCIASPRGGLREAGMDLALYADPSDMVEFRDALRCYLTDDEAIATARIAIGQHLKPPTTVSRWRDAARLLMTIAEARNTPAPSRDSAA
jgi:glycosyltransferase involved in cell wall biosynthesis